MVDEPVGGFQVRPVSELPERLQERIRERRTDANPERTVSDYDEMGW